jgi:glutamine---fructose-6-phosphate transaminase (isomerizing)
MLPWLAACAVGTTVSAWKTSNEPQHITQTESAARRLRLLAPADPFTHRTLKELNEQPEAIARTLNFGECMTFEKVLVSDLDQNQDRVTKINHLTLSAQGTSLQAARYGERLMKHLGAFASVASVDSADIQTSDFRCLDMDSTGLIVVSDCGGGSKENVPDVVPSLMEMGVTVMNVVNTLTSLLASTDKLDVFGGGAESESMSSTKVFTTQVTVLALISLWFKENRDRALGSPSAEALELKEALMRLPIVFGMTLRKRDQCREIAKRLLDKEQCFVLGAGTFVCLPPSNRLPSPFSSLILRYSFERVFQDLPNLWPMRELLLSLKSAT